MPALELQGHGVEMTIEDLPEEIVAKSLLGLDPPFSHRRVSKQLRRLFDERRTQLRIKDHRSFLLQCHLRLPAPSDVRGEPCLYRNSAESVFKHGDLLRLLRLLPSLDTLMYLERQALPWEEMGQILGGQLTHLVFRWDWQALKFLELFPSLRKLEVICGEASRPTLKLPQSLSVLSALQHLVLNGLPVKDLGPLGGCSQTLQYLDLGRCPVED